MSNIESRRSAGSKLVRVGMMAVALGGISASARSAAAQPATTEAAPPDSAAEPATPEAAPPTSAAETRHGSVFVDPLGFALFGPRLGVEGGAGHLSVGASVRWFNAGLLGRSLFLGPDDKFAFSYGAGLRARYSFGDNLAGFHLGAAAEYLRTKIENPRALIATTSSYFVPYAEVGYRVPFGQFYADASAGLGYALRLSGKVESLPGGFSASFYSAEDKSTIYGTASLDLGLYF